MRETLFNLLKADLGNLEPPDAVKEYMNACIDKAISDLRAAGIAVDAENAEDHMTIVRAAAWIYKNRDSREARPWQLQRDYNNRRLKRFGGGSCDI